MPILLNILLILLLYIITHSSSRNYSIIGYMKQIIKILSIFIAVVLVIMLMLPFVFKGKLEKIIKEEGHKYINAQFDFEKLEINILRNFPMVSVAMKDFWVKGSDAFSNDTLVNANRLTIGVNLFSFLNKGGFEITNVELDNSTFYARVLPNGKANWDILKHDSVQKPDSVVENIRHKREKKMEVDSTFLINLDRFIINNMNVVYENRQADLYTNINNFNLNCSGQFNSLQTIINMQAGASFVSFKSKGLTYLSDASVSTEIALNADFLNQKYVLKENKIRINGLTVSLGGWFNLAEDKQAIDISLATNQVSFKDILSLIPYFYTTEFQQLQTSGTAMLTAHARGAIAGDSIVPNFNITLLVDDGQFKYDNLPIGIDQINIKTEINNSGGPLNKTTISIDPFNFNMGNNPFKLSAHLTTPKEMPEFNLKANGKIDLSLLNQVFIMNNVSLNGVAQSDISIHGLLSDISQQKYNQIQALGSIGIKNIDLNIAGIPEVYIDQSMFTFTPQYLELSKTDIKIGSSNITLDSRFENYLGYIFNQSTLHGNLNISSNRINLNEFMSSTSDTLTANKNVNIIQSNDTTPSDLLIIPQNIDFKMNTNIKNLILKDLNIANIDGLITIKNATLNMHNLSFNMLGGTIAMNGLYSTSNIYQPIFNSNFKMKDIDFERAYNELDLIKQYAPIFKHLKGQFTGGMSILTSLHQNMSPILDSVQAHGSLKTSNLNLSNIKVIDDITSSMNITNSKNLKIKDLDIDFTIKNGRLTTQPFDIKLGNYNINLSGYSGLDQSIDYNGKISATHASNQSSKGIQFKINGTLNAPQFSIDSKSIIKQTTESIGKQAIKSLGEKMGLDSTLVNNEDSIKNKIKDKAIDLLKKIK